MDKKERLLQVFTEEASEIIEELDRLVMQQEEGGDSVSLINDIFRGVHTLKGSANSFGFTRLGEYVHHWEDLLGLFRDNPEFSLDASIDLFFDAVSVVRAIFDFEINHIEGLPENYIETLELIKQKLNGDEKKEVIAENKIVIKEETVEEIKTVDEIEEIEEDQSNLTFKIEDINKEELATLSDEEVDKIVEQTSNNKYLYNIILCFDEDLYFRGHNQQISVKLLEDVGQIVKSFWYYDGFDALEDYNHEHNYIKKISLYFLTQLSHAEIEEIFEFSADDHEVKTRLFSKKDLKIITDKKVEDKIEKIEEVKEIEVVEKTEIIETPTNNTIVLEKKEEIPLIVEEDRRESSDRRQGDRRHEERRETETAKTQSFIRIESNKIDELFDSVGELVIAQSYIENSEIIKETDNVDLKKNINALSKSTKRIQDQVMSLRMVAIRDTFLKMKRIARDVSKKTNKEFDFILKGEDTEIDKTMVDALSDPLIHLIRNAIDHGLESDEDRIANDKGKGQVSLEAYHRGNNIVIEIKDDGKGINVEAIKNKAIERGLMHQDQILSDSEIINFIFHPGFSMAKQISDVSGRGVGLDVVKTSIDKLKGKVDISTTLGKGSSFKIILPLTLAIIDGMIVSINEEVFIIPTLTVVESFSPDINNVSSIQHKEEFINFRGDVLPIVHLNRLLNLDGEERKDINSVFICIEHERGRFILRVDSLLGRQQVVVKSMGKFLSFVKEIVGGAILGDGKIALILNIEEIRERLDEQFDGN